MRAIFKCKTLVKIMMGRIINIIIIGRVHFFKKKAFLKFVRHFLVELVVQLFLYNSDMLISNLPYAKLYFLFYPF